MGNRIRENAEKVQVMEQVLDQINVAQAARKVGVPESTLRYDLKKVYVALPEVLRNQRPGPAPRTPSAAAAAPKTPPCPRCGGKVVKNGGYWVWNWVHMLLWGWLLGAARVRIQRWRCRECGYEVRSAEQQRQAAARVAWWQQVARLIGMSRFKLGLSVRRTQLLVGFLYARQVSVGHVQRVTQRVGQQAEHVLARLGACRQAVAQCLLFDETFPKLARRAYSLGVTVCEYGVIRSVRVITRKARDIREQLQTTVQGQFHPRYFLTDLDVTYHKYLQDAGLTLTHLRDQLHLRRQIVRLFDTAVREVTLDVPKGLPLKARQQQRRLKQRLLRKRLHPLLALVFKAFSPGYESICVLLLEGVAARLQDPAHILQTASVQRLARQLQRFIKKHGDTINTALVAAQTHHIPTTTNLVESKNAIFKPFSRLAKFFAVPQTCQAFFAGVALMENFDVKTRGPHQGTCALQRAQINWDDLGATDFFSAVNLPLPQISPALITAS